MPVWSWWDEGATAIGTILKTNRTLVTLDFECFAISFKGCAALCDSLCEAALTVSLSDLSLSQNTLHVTARGAEAVQKILTAVTSLTKLHLKGCVREKGCKAVCEGIVNNSTLRELDLRGVLPNPKHEIQDQAKDAIVKALASNTCIVKILNDCGLERGPAHGRVADAGIGDASQDARKQDSVVDKDIVDAQRYARAKGKRALMPLDDALPAVDSYPAKHHKSEERAHEQREAAGAAAGMCVKIEEYDGSYECVICSQSVRGNAAVLHCSQCSSNPFH